MVTAALSHNEAIDEQGRIVIGVPSYGYHGSNLYSEAAVIAYGLPADGGNDRRLGMHVVGHAASAFRGTVKILAGNGGSVRAAVDHAGDGGLVFDIYKVLGWDTDLHAPLICGRLSPREAEVAILRQVPPESIKMIADVVTKRRGAASGLYAVNWRPLGP